MTQFFSHNFKEDRWRKAALKNAFSLLGKQRFEQSAAFFLLAGSLKDAIEVFSHSFTIVIGGVFFWLFDQVVTFVKQYPMQTSFLILGLSGKDGRHSAGISYCSVV